MKWCLRKRSRCHTDTKLAPHFPHKGNLWWLCTNTVTSDTDNLSLHWFLLFLTHSLSRPISLTVSQRIKNIVNLLFCHFLNTFRSIKSNKSIHKMCLCLCLCCCLTSEWSSWGGEECHQRSDASPGDRHPSRGHTAGYIHTHKHTENETTHWWNVTKYIYSSTVFKYDLEVLVLYLSISIFMLLYISSPLDFRGKYCTFYSTTFIWQI